ncbi:MAG: DUF2029 domain-containing protein [Candidatus Omnitrophica bacterium]|nr:DUF2029 domain-containing protein [Candidatus Omnitrophota bacterium]MBI3082948.1 DUF2029 domain-containing protein [Candidatus Omnitrophota bacterium]
MMLLLVGITGVKLLVASLWGTTADIPQTLEQAQSFLAGEDVLNPASTGGNPSFFPLGHYLLASWCLLASQWTGLSFAFLIKAPAILADLLVALLLRLVPRGGDQAAFLYLVNPVTFLLSVYHGQLHTVAMAAAVLALWLDARHSRWLVGLALGMAAGIRQHFGVLIVPFLLRRDTRRWVIALSFGSMVGLMNVWFLTSASPERLLAPTWTYGSWGYTMLLLQGPRVLAALGFHGLTNALAQVNALLRAVGPAIYWVWTIGFLCWVWRRSHRTGIHPWEAALLFLVGLYTVSPGFGVQWLVWAIPFWLVVNRLEAMGYCALAGAFLIGSYWQWSLNAHYGGGALTTKLHLLTKVHLAGVILVGAAGVATWLYAARTTWRLWRT